MGGKGQGGEKKVKGGTRSEASKPTHCLSRETRLGGQEGPEEQSHCKVSESQNFGFSSQLSIKIEVI